MYHPIPYTYITFIPIFLRKDAKNAKKEKKLTKSIINCLIPLFPYTLIPLYPYIPLHLKN